MYKFLRRIIGLGDYSGLNNPVEDSADRGLTSLNINPAHHYKSHKVSRRALILGGLAAATGLFGLGKILQNPTKNKFKPANTEPSLPESQVIIDNKIYGDGGEIKTEVAYVQIDGWKVLFEELSVLNSNAQMLHDGTRYDFKIKCPLGHQHGWFTFPSSPNSDITLGDILETYRDAESSKVKRYSSTYYFVHSLPHLGDKPMTLELVISDSGRGTLEEQIFNPGSHETKPTQVFRYSISPKIYTSKPENRNDEVRVLSEREISGEMMQSVHNLHRTFSAYKKPALVYIVDEETKRLQEAGHSSESGFFIPGRDFILLTTDSFLRPDFRQQGEQVACHEMAHNIVQYAKFEGKERTAVNELNQSFEVMKERAGDDNDYRGFAIFREATHLGKSGIESVAGHPWDDPSELFASAIRTFRYLAEGFVEEYARLDEQDKVLVKSASLNVLNLLSSMNPSEKALRQLLPDIDIIRAALRS